MGKQYIEINLLFSTLLATSQGSKNTITHRTSFNIGVKTITDCSSCIPIDTLAQLEEVHIILKRNCPPCCISTHTQQLQTRDNNTNMYRRAGIESATHYAAVVSSTTGSNTIVNISWPYLQFAHLPYCVAKSLDKQCVRDSNTGSIDKPAIVRRVYFFKCKQIIEVQKQLNFTQILIGVAYKPFTHINYWFLR